MNTQFFKKADFLAEMNWDKYGNVPSVKFDETWSTILSSINNQFAGNKGLHVCDSVFGSGKTLSACVASSILSRDWEGTGTMIVVPLTDQAIVFAENFNSISERLAGKKIVLPMFYFKQSNKDGEIVNGKLTAEQILDTQVLVITHKRYLSSLSGRCGSEFQKWRGSKRQFHVDLVKS